MKSIVAAIAALALAVVSAQEMIVHITAPLAGQVYTAGQKAHIAWIDPKVDTIPVIKLARGDPKALTQLQDIGTNVPTAAGGYDWTIPADIEPGNDYAFELGNSPNVAYTGQFTIKAGDGAAGNSTASGSGSSSAAVASSTAPATTKSAAPSDVSSAASTPAASSASPAASGAGSSGAAGDKSTDKAGSGSASTTPSTAPDANKDSAAGKTTATFGALAVAGVAAMALM
ncbi:uncharacterized protein BYT42DRAFT_23528 [Radiomyces spectabilis]|uniref:uncharacterized protein n=1 Tax=Radiomyces spectabilis TaxID=64574 RepID=UPI00221EBD1E|nr:uncharacterized protein BYT42DRAFT_23528 [Radiomyces spectabilis]KAI8393917.1 hypothetical protein BYT42DRAFT_23528 [Radiomyces spectabilis]